MKITILGARGSVPTNGAQMLEFGGSTSCVLVETDEHAIFLDAGTGMIRTPDLKDKQISILITHPHFDHLIGMPFFPYNAQPGRRINVYGKERGGLGIKEQLKRLISPPLWPCTLEEYKADYSIRDLKLPLDIGGIKVDAIESQHPGGSLIYRLSDGTKSMVYATDYEYCEEKSSELIDFSKDADLLLIDAQYTEEEAKTRKGFGHSTVEAGRFIMEQSHARSLRFVHHDPRHSDEQLNNMEKEILSDKASFAREGEVIEL